MSKSYTDLISMPFKFTREFFVDIDDTILKVIRQTLTTLKKQPPIKQQTKLCLGGKAGWLSQDRTVRVT